MKKHHFVVYQANDEPRKLIGWKIICESCGSWVISQIPISTSTHNMVKTIEIMKRNAANSYPEDCEEAWVFNIAKDIHSSLMVIHIYESESCCQYS